MGNHNHLVWFDCLESPFSTVWASGHELSPSVEGVGAILLEYEQFFCQAQVTSSGATFVFGACPEYFPCNVWFDAGFLAVPKVV